MTHSLVIGGSGMLREFCLAIATRGDLVSVVGRDRARIEAISPPDSPTRIQPLSVDYHDLPALRRSIAGAIARHGPIARAVCWIHATAPGAARAVGEAIGVPGPDTLADSLEVLGSTALAHVDGPGRRPPGWAASLAISYRACVLGAVHDGHASRWLTHHEISSGVLEALDSGRSLTIVGTTRPGRHPT